jgi:hypothetical protein
VDWTVAQGRPLPAGRPTAEERDDPAPFDGAASDLVGGERQAELADRMGAGASRAHGAAFLGVIVVVQLAWLMTLGYAFLRLVA